MSWNGTNIKSSWLRKQGRGNTSGRTKDWRFTEWFCDGCQKKHGSQITRYETLDKKLLCSRQFDKHLNR